MKKIVLFVCFVPIICYAQISTVKINQDKREIITPYDSLKSINEENYKSHIGQTLYLIEDVSIEKEGVYSDFYLRPSYRSKHYKEAKGNSTLRAIGSNYNDMKGRYFYVNEVIMEPKSYSSQTDEGYLKLIEKESGDTVYFHFHGIGLGLAFNVFLTVGYFEKLKSTYVGSEFVYVDNRPNTSFNQEKDGIRNLNDGTERKEIQKGKVFKCVDFVVSDNKYSPILVIIYNDEYNKSFVWLDDIVRTDLYWNKFVPKEKYDKMLADNEKRKNDLIRKYGQTNADLILDGKVRIGFSQQMCKESWGEPQKINRTSGSYGVHEQWVYGSSTYLYFENGKLTTIQN